MECKQVTTLLNRYMDGECDPGSESAIGNHLSRCTDCKTEFDALLQLSQSLKNLPEVEAGPSFTARIMQRVHQRRSFVLPVRSLAYGLLFLFSFTLGLLTNVSLLRPSGAEKTVRPTTLTRILMQSQKMNLLSSQAATIQLLVEGSTDEE